MDNAFKAAGNLLPYHLLAYGALLGTELFQARPVVFKEAFMELTPDRAFSTPRYVTGHFQ